MSITQPESLSRTLTFLFTDLEGSTRLWQRDPERMRSALQHHDEILRTAITSSSGEVVKTTGDGFMCVFTSTPDALDACLAAQRTLGSTHWEGTGPLLVRMGLHAGHAEARDGDYFGPTVIRAARIMAAAHGGQVLLSETAAALVLDRLPEGAALRDLGEHRLRDLERPEHLYQAVAEDLESEFPPLTSAEDRPSNLPTPTTALIGRDTEAAAIRDRFGDDAVRLLTLIGPGGTGKTRLAVRAAAELVDRFPDGVFFVDLSAATDTAAVIAAIARVVGLTERSDQALRDDLTRHLRDRRALLVLDNFEQVTVAAPLLAELLGDAPGLRLLVTSREALHVRGEHLLPVPPLSLPDDARAAAPTSASELERFEAIRLFVERARAVRPDFQLTNENATAVAEICRRLDGLPLAIELATARLSLFSPEALRDRLRTRLDVLRSGARDLPARQQTLASTIDWSYQLLAPDEQRLFAALSAFATPDVEAVEAVAAAVEELSGASMPAFEALASLIDKSLIRRIDDADAGPHVTMLETIREYASERLAERPAFKSAVRDAHAAHFADRAHARWTDLAGVQRDSALRAMAGDLADLRLAWRTSVEERDLDRIDRLVDSLWLFYDARGWLHGTIELASDMVAVMSERPATPELASQQIVLQLGLARILMAARGFTSEVEEAFARAVASIEEQGSIPPLFPALRGMATFYMYRAQPEKSVELGQAIIRLAEQEDDRGMAIEGQLLVGAGLGFADNPRRGLEHLDRAIALGAEGPRPPRRFRFGNDPVVAAHTTSAFMLWLLGHPDRAVERSDRGVALAAELEHPFTMAYALFHNGVLHLWRRESAELRDRAVGVLSIAQEHDFRVWEALGTIFLGAASAELGRPTDGLEMVRKGQQLYRGLRSPPVFWPMLLMVEAGACLRAGRAAEGLAAIDDALGIFGGYQTAVLPEFETLKGDLLLALPQPDRPGAEAAYRRAYEVSQRFGTKMPQLRAATRLARLHRDDGNGREAVALLEPLLETITEGAGTTDVIEARAALEGRA